MKLNELASEYDLEPELLREVVEEDLDIALPGGMDTDLAEEQIRRILACDGLETNDGKEFAPIIDEEFVERHKRSLAAKKAAQTRKAKALAEEEAKAAAEARIQEEERKKHEEALREQEEKRRLQQEEAERRRLAEEQQSEAREAEFQARHDEEQRRAEEQLRRREEEQARINAELAALREEEAARARGETVEPDEPASDDEPADDEPADEADAPAASDSDEAAATSDVQPEAAAAPAAEPAKEEPKKTKLKVGGSKLASLAKSTAEKSDHRVKDKDIKALPDAPKASNTAEPDQVLSAEERQKMIQDNIRRNLAMADRVKKAKQQSRRRGFKAIDRSKGPGPDPRSAGPGGPGSRGGPGPNAFGPGGPGGRGPGGGPAGRGRGRGKKKTDRYDKLDTTDERNIQRRQRRVSTEEEDLSGIREFSIEMPCTVREFSEASGIKANVVIAKLFMAGVAANVNSTMDKDQAELMAAEFEKEVTFKEATNIEDEIEEFHVDDDPDQLAPRPPVVTILGHVDHGKTSLLDAIRHTEVTDSEAGGITQHIGAYTVSTDDGLEVTFIDTPGHEAFTEMRARGSQATDLAVIVVAADDGVMPQTIESINHVRAAGVPFIIACNKMDVEGAQPDKLLRELSEQNVLTEDWGGDIGVVKTSAITGEGIPELIERLALESEVLELQANHFAEASGIVLEAHMSEGQGITSTLLIQRGSLAAGDIVLAGSGYGRVRNMRNWKGEVVGLAGPSTAVEIIGLSDLPRAGDKFHVVKDLKTAAEAADVRRHRMREMELRAKSKTTTLDSLFDDIADQKVKELRLIVKADTSGSLEVLRKTLGELGNDEVRVNLIHSGVGCVSTGDVTLAEASNAIIIGFHVIADTKARQQADEKGIDIKSYTIIYELLDNVKAALSGMLSPELVQEVVGHAETRAVFKSSKFGTIAGLYITDGVVTRGCGMRITRDGVIIHDGKVNTLRRFQEDVREVRDGYECGLTVDRFHDIVEGDIFEFYTTQSVARTL